VDPHAENYFNASPYTYVENNPIIRIDPDGRDWIDIDGNKLTQEQLKGVKVYIFFNSKPSSESVDPKDIQQQGQEGGFLDQTRKQYLYYSEKYGQGSVALSSVDTTDDFANDWGEIDGTPVLIKINHHGSNQAIHLSSEKGEYIVSTIDGKTNRSGTPGLSVADLPNTKGDVSNTALFLNTCNSNNEHQTPIKSGTTLARSFSLNTDVGTVRASNLGVSFRKDGLARPQLFGEWQFLKKGSQVNNQYPLHRLRSSGL